jgi:predicted nucleic acid-binding protein
LRRIYKQHSFINRQHLPRRVQQSAGHSHDLLIAAQATALGYTIVTDNEREFSRIEGLACENWLRPV